MGLAVVQGVFQLIDKWRSLTHRREDKRWFEEDATWHEEDIIMRNSEYNSHLEGQSMRRTVREYALPSRHHYCKHKSHLNLALRICDGVCTDTTLIAGRAERMGESVINESL